MSNEKNNESIDNPKAFDAYLLSQHVGSSDQMKNRPPTASSLSLTNRVPFPMKLFQMLEDAEREGNQWICSWSQDGTAFKVHDPAAFVSRIMPRYFRQTRYKSFQRQCHLYGYIRVSSGNLKGHYRHPKFRKHNRDMCREMVPLKRSMQIAEKQIKTKEPSSPTPLPYQAMGSAMKTVPPVGRTRSQAEGAASRVNEAGRGVIGSTRENYLSRTTGWQSTMPPVSSSSSSSLLSSGPIQASFINIYPPSSSNAAILANSAADSSRASTVQVGPSFQGSSTYPGFGSSAANNLPFNMVSDNNLLPKANANITSLGMSGSTNQNFSEMSPAQRLQIIQGTAQSATIQPIFDARSSMILAANDTSKGHLPLQQSLSYLEPNQTSELATGTSQVDPSLLPNAGQDMAFGQSNALTNQIRPVGIPTATLSNPPNPNASDTTYPNIPSAATSLESWMMDSGVDRNLDDEGAPSSTGYQFPQDFDYSVLEPRRFRG